MITKRVLALVLALMMTLTLFGCGEKPAEQARCGYTAMWVT